MADEFAARAVLWAVALIIFGAVVSEFVSREGPHRRASVGLAISVLMGAVGIWWDSLGQLIPFIGGSWGAGLVAAVVIAALGVGWLIGHNRAKRASRKGRKGLLDVVVDVPKLMAAQDRRVHAIAGLLGQLQSLIDAAGVDAASHGSRVASANRIASAVAPLARQLRREAEGFQAETKTFSADMEGSVWSRLSRPYAGSENYLNGRLPS